MNEVVAFSEKYLDTLQRYADLEKDAKRIEEKKKKVRQEILEAMEFYNLRSFDYDLFKLTVVAPSVSTTIDTKALRISDPDTYDKLIEVYPKKTERKSSLRVTLK